MAVGDGRDAPAAVCHDVCRSSAGGASSGLCYFISESLSGYRVDHKGGAWGQSRDGCIRWGGDR